MQETYQNTARTETPKTQRELEQEQCAILTGIRKEFTQGELSGDILQDFATFLDHHSEVERNYQLAHSELGKYVSLSGTYCKQRDQARDALRLFHAGKVIALYDERLRKHPYFKRFIAHTPFENDCAAIAFEVVKEILEMGEKPVNSLPCSD